MSPTCSRLVVVVACLFVHRAAHAQNGPAVTATASSTLDTSEEHAAWQPLKSGKWCSAKDDRTATWTARFAVPVQVDQLIVFALAGAGHGDSVSKLTLTGDGRPIAIEKDSSEPKYTFHASPGKVRTLTIALTGGGPLCLIDLRLLDAGRTRVRFELGDKAVLKKIEPFFARLDRAWSACNDTALDELTEPSVAAECYGEEDKRTTYTLNTKQLLALCRGGVLPRHAPHIGWHTFAPNAAATYAEADKRERAKGNFGWLRWKARVANAGFEVHRLEFGNIGTCPEAPR
jgi:hypothetical protein